MEHVIYAKFSRERKEEYGIVTKIVADEGTKRIEKVALSERGFVHLAKIQSNMDILKKYYLSREFVIVPCHMKDEGTIEFEYVDGVRYDEYFSNITIHGDVEKIEKELEHLTDILYDVAEIKKFYITEEFETVFGKGLGKILDGKKAYAISNVDMIFSNIIIKNQKLYVTDYEWVFDFPVPVDYILYRSLLLNVGFSMLDEGKRRRILTFMHISDTDIACYEKMEDRFQLYVSGKKLFSEYKKKSGKGIIQLKEVAGEIKTRFARVYVKEEKEDYVLQQCIPYKKQLQIEDTLTRETKGVKIQFDVEGAVLKLEEFYAFDKDGKKVSLTIKHNAELVINDDYYFGCDSPYFEFRNEGYDSFGMKILVYYEDSSIIGHYIKKIAECESYRQELIQVNAKIDWLKKMKIWKICKKLMRL